MSLIEQANSNTKREPGKKETSVARAEDDITETPNRIRSVGFGGLDTRPKLCTRNNAHNCALMLSRRALFAAPTLLLPHESPPIPLAAAEAGYVSRTFFDDFSSIATVDIDETGNTGYKWYKQQFFGADLVPAGDISVANSVLTLNGSVNHTNTARCRLFTQGYLGGTRTTQGSTFAEGAYFEARFSYDPSLATPYPRPGWPAFWAHDRGLLLAQTNLTAYHGAEIDFWEAYPSENGTTSNLMTVHDWTVTNGTFGTSITNSNNNVGGNLGSPDFTQLNTYGCLWIPASKNGGTGLLQRYFNGVHVSALDISYSATGPASPSYAFSPNLDGTLSILDSSNFVVVIEGSFQWPVSFDYVAVWQ